MKCHITDCKKKTVVIGNCNYCKKQYCMIHRMVESHKCNNIQDCYTKAHATFSKQLVENKCVAVKINKI